MERHFLQRFKPWVSVPHLYDDGSLYRITDKTKEKAVTIYPSDLCGELKKWAIKNSDVIEILGRIEQDV